MSTLAQDRTLDDLGVRHPDGLDVTRRADGALVVRVAADWRQYLVTPAGVAHLTHNAGGRRR